MTQHSRPIAEILAAKLGAAATMRRWARPGNIPSPILCECCSRLVTKISPALIVLFTVAPAFPQANGSLVTHLREQDERLLTAVHRGDRTTWERLTTPDFEYVEEGVIQPRKEFLESIVDDGLQPLIIREYRVKLSGETAIVVHVDDVPSAAAPDGSPARYLMTETWQLIAGAWKLRLVHIEAIRTDPPAVALSAEQIDELVGTYKAGKQALLVRRERQRILLRRITGSEHEVRAETRDVLFVPGDTRMRLVFIRNTEGRVTGVAERYENLELRYQRND